MFPLKLVATAIAALVLVGCQTVQSNVTAFHMLQPGTGKTFSVKAEANSLEAATYAELISKRLEQHGWTRSGTGEVEVRFAYGVDDGRTTITAEPIYGQTGGGQHFMSGDIFGPNGPGSFAGSTISPPTYGVIGARPVATTTYRRGLSVDMFSRAGGTKLFEASVTSTGQGDSFAAVASCMIDALFEDFPGRSGVSRNVNLDASDCGK